MLSSITSAGRRIPLCRICRSRQLFASISPLVTRHHSTLTPRSSPNRSLPFASSSAPSRLTPDAFKPQPPPPTLNILRILLNRLPEYVQSERFRSRLDDYGLQQDTQDKLVDLWENELVLALEQAQDEQSAKMVLARGDWNEENLVQSFQGEGAGFAQAAESTFHRKFVAFASAHPLVPPGSQAHLKAILEATDLTRMVFRGERVKARSMTRHFHLHIGPTNSGKTYNALKALARAETGAYAGPLRLLAHEVWERINLGTVGGLDGQGKQCNLLTGEERRIVDPDAGLMSCTVEMLPLGGPPGGFDVVVIDEIQMMGDAQRGGAWTNAVFGVCAKEIHLCGDETTVDLLSKLIPTMGDQMTIHKYERLTPLQVADESLNGDWNKVEAGDAIVTFSRNNIYAIKKKIESIAAKKCAVIYGALPPETRADQARDFNDENGRCQVLVASDAVGMGLNLKIKRIIFESLEKFNGKSEVPLSLTQVKQIAGRAGRFGMQRKKTEGEENEDPVKPDEVPEAGGMVTTLHKSDLPILKAVLPMELPKIKRATVDIPFNTLSELSVLLPPNTPYADVLDHLHNLVVLPPSTRTSDFHQVVPVTQILEPYRNQLTLAEIDLFTSAPVNTRDLNIVNIFENIVKLYAQQGLVEIDPIFLQTRFLSLLDIVEGTLATLPPLPPIIGIGRKVLTPPVIVSSIPSMESMHRALVMYIWLSFRLEVAFPERVRAVEIKERVEAVLDDCLARFPGLRNLKTYERTKEGDRAVADWRKENVAPNGTRKLPGSDRKGILWVESAVVQRLRNKQIWQSTGVVPAGKVLKEADGKGPRGRVAPDYNVQKYNERKLLGPVEDADSEETRRRIYEEMVDEEASEDPYDHNDRSTSARQDGSQHQTNRTRRYEGGEPLRRSDNNRGGRDRIDREEGAQRLFGQEERPRGGKGGPSGFARPRE